MNFPMVFRQLGLLLLLLATLLLVHAGVAGMYFANGDEAERAAIGAFLTAAGIAGGSLIRTPVAKILYPGAR